MNKDQQKYIGLITSQHKTRPLFLASVLTSINPLIDCLNFLDQLNAHYDVDSANDPYLQTLAHWVGAPLVISGAAQLEYFGFIDQDNSMTFGEIDDPEVGGYFRESGQSGTGGLVPKGEFLRRLIQAKILRNNCTGNIDESKQIIKLVLDHELFKVTDNNDMTVSFTFLTNANTTQRILVKMFFPLPAGVELIIEN
ncbi:DUF2612 domain-containing protein [Acinetobacter sp. ANC 4648]|uniref:DUF2612 domain-containing protein n=1 Tax=Acinetobacter sp. ANC 4648 TaxID=1977875 RepID=UPI000A34456D|nr:DUF2612 domain-containing protein [Acinetobacter sp. ANC 4648]OTG82339.1 hypothetical protein B9T27_08880 [Acinetobacter sp. ANC 4648]